MIWMSRNLQKFPTQVFFWIYLQSAQNRAGWIAVVRLFGRATLKSSHAYSMEPGTHRGMYWAFFCLSLHWGEPSPMLRLSWSKSMGKTEWLHQNTQKREAQFMHFNWLRKTCFFCTIYCDTQKSLPRNWKQSLFWEYTEISYFLLVRSTKLFHYNSERMGC